MPDGLQTKQQQDLVVEFVKSIDATTQPLP
jgi:hypothetical protein